MQEWPTAKDSFAIHMCSCNRLYVLQVTAEHGEASGQNMWTLVKAMTDGTQWKGKSADYAWRQAQKDHPKHFIPK